MGCFECLGSGGERVGETPELLLVALTLLVLVLSFCIGIISAEGLVLGIDFRGGSGGNGGNSVLHRGMLLLSAGLGSVEGIEVVTGLAGSCTGCFMGVIVSVYKVGCTVLLLIISVLGAVAVVVSSRIVLLLEGFGVVAIVAVVVVGDTTLLLLSSHTILAAVLLLLSLLLLS